MTRGHRLILFAVAAAALAALAPPLAAAVQAPPVTITGGPSGPTNVTAPTFTFSVGNAGGEWDFECSVDGAAFVPSSCSNVSERKHTTPELADGPHTFEVRGARSGEEFSYAQRSFEVDTDAPEVSIASFPDSPSNDPTPSWSFISDQDVAFYCLVFGDTHYTPCGSGTSGEYTTHPVGDGDHTFLVTGFDPAGNPAPFSGDGFTVDTAFPVARIKGFRRTRDRTPSFGLSADPGSTFTCSVDGRAFRACGPELTLGPLRRGIHSLQVLATDPARNKQGAPTYARIRIIPLPCNAYRKARLRQACRCNRIRNRAKRRSCRAAGRAAAPRGIRGGSARS